ncbi:hypothetical protein QVD17_07587 [Tagetes erecta]|uniref:Late embryogenesis abundant protein LEA-2 subgroup domain-containing protein n=1 Tax=Tagetes erecta TaxID=13708 RepID=A0AAD8LMR0_TARER|nr:hypothetical protein QVD17_07587 [Tagetes erecta]
MWHLHALLHVQYIVLMFIVAATGSVCGLTKSLKLCQSLIVSKQVAQLPTLTSMRHIAKLVCVRVGFLSSLNENPHSISTLLLSPSSPPPPATIVLRHSMEKRGPPSSSIYVGDAPPVEKPSTRPIKYILISMVILKVVMGIIFWIVLLMTKKDDPLFHVESVHAITNNKTNQEKYKFDITLASKNPNAHTIILFDDHGKTSLSFKDKTFATGEFPSSKQDPKQSKDVKLTLTSFSNTELPTEIQTSMNETNKVSKKHVEILLEFRVPVKMKIGILETKSKTLSMLCHFKVDNLIKNSRIVSQNFDYSTRA